MLAKRLARQGLAMSAAALAAALSQNVLSAGVSGSGAAHLGGIVQDIQTKTRPAGRTRTNCRWLDKTTRPKAPCPAAIQRHFPFGILEKTSEESLTKWLAAIEMPQLPQLTHSHLSNKTHG
jgi:hypothetical protein